MNKRSVGGLVGLLFLTGVTIWWLSQRSKLTVLPVGLSNPEVVATPLPDGTTNYVVQAKNGAPSLPNPQTRISPSPIELKEYKVQGSKYTCRLTGIAEGRGDKEGWMVVKGGAHFVYQTELEWDAQVLKNADGIVEEKRTFRMTRASAAVSLTEFGLTELGSKAATLGVGILALKLGVPPGQAKWAAVTVGQLSKFDVLPDVPWVGPWLKSQLEPVAGKDPNAEAMRIATKKLAELEGKEVIVTWKNGKLYDCKATVGGLSDADKEYAAKAAVFADMNVFPPGEKKIGESWVAMAGEILDYFQTESDVKEATRGKVLLVRDNDAELGRVAVINGAGKASFNGKKYEGDAKLDGLRAEFSYGGGNKYLRTCISTGTVEYIRLDQGHLLFGLKTTVKPKFRVEYACEQK